jgi:hypothetical protein
MSTSSSALHCVTCHQPLPEGQEPEYFAQVSAGYQPEYEVERAAEDVSQLLRYAQTVNASAWSMLQVASVNSPDLMDPECYLDEAHSLCFLLKDLVEDAQRHIDTLHQLVKEKLEAEEARTAALACRKEGN